MPRKPPLPSFSPFPPDGAGIITWIHIGDLHITHAGEQNQLDLEAIVDEINLAFSQSTSFVYIPGDVADQGAAAQYEIVRAALDRLQLPWCAILGDHDVHEKSYTNFLHSMAHEKSYSFSIGNVRFVALNAFDLPDPGSFTLLPVQLDWVGQELAQARGQRQRCVILMHCYPSDLKRGGEQLSRLLRANNVHLVDMGHTHYNEIANDGHLLYTATRSTGQIEEGPVGFSVTNIDGKVISWKFLNLSELPAVMISSPSDERLIVDPDPLVDDKIYIRAKTWGASPITSASAQIEDRSIPLQRIEKSAVWQGNFARDGLKDGVYPLTVSIQDQDGKVAQDTVRIIVGRPGLLAPTRSPRDQDNAVAAWPEHGLLGTQLGPNKNGRKW